MAERESMAQLVEDQISDGFKAWMRDQFGRQLARPAGLLFEAKRAGENVTGLTRLHVAVWLARPQ